MFTFKKLSTCPLHSKCANRIMHTFRVQYICLIIAFNVFFFVFVFLLFNVVFVYETLKRRHGLWRQTSIRALISSLLYIAPLDAILKPKNLEHSKELWVRKAVVCGYSAKELPKTCAHKESVPSSVPEYKVETLYSGTGTVPEFWRGYLEKRCVHISAHQESYSGTVLGHQV